MYKLLGRYANSMLVVAVTHDLNLALRFSSHVIVMENGNRRSKAHPRNALAPN